MQYEANRSISQKEFCGVVKNWQNGRLEIQVKNRIDENSELEVVMPKIADDFSFIAEDLKFGEETVTVFHGGNDNAIATLKCEKEIPAGVFIRQKVKNTGLVSEAEQAQKSYKA